jgi:hypothetical protein
VLNLPAHLLLLMSSHLYLFHVRMYQVSRVLPCPYREALGHPALGSTARLGGLNQWGSSKLARHSVNTSLAAVSQRSGLVTGTCSKNGDRRSRIVVKVNVNVAVDAKVLPFR